MANIYLDPEGGNDTNNGSTFALRKKTYSSALNTAASNDTVRVIASNKYKKLKNTTDYASLYAYDRYFFERGTGDLSGDSSATKIYAERFNHFDASTGWTASTNVTVTTVGGNTYKYAATSFANAAGFAGGKMAYKAFSSSDTNIQTLSVWLKQFQNNSGVTLSIRLCSDTTGDTAVYTWDITGSNFSTAKEQIFKPFKKDFGSVLDFSTIQSISVHCATSGAKTFILDNLIGTVATTSPECITHDQILWGTQSTYLTDFGYTQGSNSDILEADAKKHPLLLSVRFITTVTDGSGNYRVAIAYDTSSESTDTDTINTSGTSKGNHPPATQSELYFHRYVVMATDDTTAITAYAKNITISGGWNRTDMSSQTDGDWTFSERLAGNSLSQLSYGTTTNLTTNIDKVFFVREAIANTTPHFRFYNGQIGIMGYVNCNYPGGTPRLLEIGTSLANWGNAGGITKKNTDSCIFISGAGKLNIGGTAQEIERIIFVNSRNYTAAWTAFDGSAIQRNCKINHLIGLYISNDIFSFAQSHDTVYYTKLWGMNAGTSTNLFSCTSATTLNIKEVIARQAATTFDLIQSTATAEFHIKIGKMDVEGLTQQTMRVNSQGSQPLIRGIITADEFKSGSDYIHKTLHSHYYWISQSSDTYSGTGKAWQIYPLNSTLVSTRPAFFPIAKVAVKNGTTVTFKIRVKRSGTGIKAKLVCLGNNKFNDYTEVLSSETAGSAGAWEQLTISPTIVAGGVAEIGLLFYDSTTQNIIVDSFEVTT